MKIILQTIFLLLCGLAGSCLAVPPDKAAAKRVTNASADYVKEGFKVRAEFWSGSAEPGKKQAIKHQLFRGNEYWFWLGSDSKGTRLAVKVYDEKGRPVDVETKSGDGAASARVLPPQTGNYTIIFVSEKKDGSKEFAWAMTYGYR